MEFLLFTIVSNQGEISFFFMICCCGLQETNSNLHLVMSKNRTIIHCCIPGCACYGFDLCGCVVDAVSPLDVIACAREGTAFMGPVIHTLSKTRSPAPEEREEAIWSSGHVCLHVVVACNNHMQTHNRIAQQNSGGHLFRCARCACDNHAVPALRRGCVRQSEK